MLNPNITVDDPTTHIATKVDAKDEDINAVLFAPVYENGRSEFCWLVLADGSVALALFPQGDLFERLSQKGTFEP